ncbi:MAG: UvrD-helicase domain-containing protein [Christensenellaceae bacterium]|nr:UvrD-helicase domain-containing protein [Christensenellaceae bacterium]
MAKYTPQQLDAITDNSHTLLVSAAAGAGKTSVLVQRIMRMLVEDKIDIRRMLILTFTHAAASELKERISKQLFDLALEDSSLQKQLDNVAFAHIETLHSFCGSLVRSQFQVVDVDPRVRVCPTSLRDKLYDAALEDTLDFCYDNPTLEMESLIACYNENQIMEMLRELYTTMMSLPYPLDWLRAKTGLNDDNTANYNISEAEIYKEVYNSFYNNIFEDFVDAYIVAEETCNICSDIYCPDIYKEVGNNDKDSIYGCYQMALNKDVALFDAIETIKFKNLPSAKKADKELYGEDLIDKYKSLITESRQGLKDEIKDIATRSAMIKKAPKDNEQMLINLRGLAQITIVFHNIFRKIKNKVNTIDFNDMEQFALEILNTEGIAERVSSAFDAIFIDECQDNSSIQEEILNKLHSASNKLFMVGDVKQSIYRFRQAEPTLFMEKMKSYPYEKSDEAFSKRKILLNKNFRSTPLVLDGVNRVFSHVMQEDITELNYLPDEDWLVAGREDKEAVPVSLSVLENRVEDLDNIELQANFVTKQIKQMIGKTILSTGKPLMYRDIVILCSQMKGVEDKIRKVFEEENIPLYADVATTEEISIETEQVLSWLTLLTHPLDDISLIAVLRGPIFALTEETLAQIRLMHPDRDVSFSQAFYSCADSADALLDAPTFEENEQNYAQYDVSSEGVYDIIDDEQKIIEIEESFSDDILGFKVDVPWSFGNKLLLFSEANKYQSQNAELTEAAKDVGISQKDFNLFCLCADIRRILSQERFLCQNMLFDKYIWNFYQRSGLFSFFATFKEGEKYADNLRSICVRAKKFQEEREGNLEDFIEDCRSLQKSGDSLSPVLLSPKDDLVRIMTIHKSKGLEFPYVFVIGLEKDIASRGGTGIFIHSKLGVALEYINSELYIKRKTLPQTIINLVKQKELQAERARLLYVAMTRAREALHLSTAFKESKNYSKFWDINNKSLAVKRAKSMADWVCQAVYKDNDALCLREENIPQYDDSCYENAFEYKNISEMLDNGTFKHWNINLLYCDDSFITIEDIDSSFNAKNKSFFDILEDIKAVQLPDDTPTIQLESSTDFVNQGLVTKQYDHIPLKTTVTTIVQSLKDEPVYEGYITDAPMDLPAPRLLPKYRPKSIKYAKRMPDFMMETKPLSAAQIGSASHTVFENLDIGKVRAILGSGGSDIDPDEKLSEAGKKPQSQSLSKYTQSQIEEAQKALNNKDFSSNNLAAQLYNVVLEALDKLLNMGHFDEELYNKVDVLSIAKFFLSPLGLRMLNSHVVYREKPFTLHLKGWATSLMQGVIDLCFIENEKWIIVDFKTDKSKTAEGLQENYLQQMNMYRLALEKLSPFNVAECYIYSLYYSEALRV